MSFKYQRRTIEDMEKVASGGGSDFIGIVKDQFKTYTAKKGTNYIRFLPPTWEDAKHYGMPIWVHYGIGPERGAVVCLAKQLGTACPICEARSLMERQGDQAGADELAPSKRVAAYILDRGAEVSKTGNEEIKVYVMPRSLDADIVKICIDPRTRELYFIDDPDQGFEISFERNGDGRNTKYSGEQVARRPSSVPSYVIDFIVQNPLPDAFLYRDYASVKAIYEGAVATTASAPPAADPGPARAPAATYDPRPEPPDNYQPAASAQAAPQEPSPAPSGRPRLQEPTAAPVEPPPAQAAPPPPAGDLDEAAARRARIAAIRNQIKGQG